MTEAELLALFGSPYGLGLMLLAIVGIPLAGVLALEWVRCARDRRRVRRRLQRL